MTTYISFTPAIRDIHEALRDRGQLIPAQKWQSIDVPDGIQFREHINNYFEVALGWETDLDFWADDIQPNLPWADVAFHERVNGIPWNPGLAWESWPWAKSAEQFKPEIFSHSYAERYWPKLANVWSDEMWGKVGAGARPLMPMEHKGIRYQYGDLEDVVKLLTEDRLTRQAYLPIFFPEDTGVVHGERVPCTLGYHFIWRDNQLSITYYIRSCDFIRHFRDDLYMSLRLLLWVADKLPYTAHPGSFTFHCVSMHCFEHDKL